VARSSTSLHPVLGAGSRSVVVCVLTCEEHRLARAPASVHDFRCVATLIVLDAHRSTKRVGPPLRPRTTSDEALVPGDQQILPGFAKSRSCFLAVRVHFREPRREASNNRNRNRKGGAKRRLPLGSRSGLGSVENRRIAFEICRGFGLRSRSYPAGIKQSTSKSNIVTARVQKLARTLVLSYLRLSRAFGFIIENHPGKYRPSKSYAQRPRPGHNEMRWP
jgi:hypothetical protein